MHDAAFFADFDLCRGGIEFDKLDCVDEPNPSGRDSCN
jgi:hypothetical protein